MYTSKERTQIHCREDTSSVRSREQFLRTRSHRDPPQSDQGLERVQDDTTQPVGLPGSRVEVIIGLLKR